MKKILAILLAMLMLATFCSCGAPTGSGDSDVIKIGYVNPTTGPLAGNGEGCEWAVKQITDRKSVV